MLLHTAECTVGANEASLTSSVQQIFGSDTPFYRFLLTDITGILYFIEAPFIRAANEKRAPFNTLTFYCRA